MRITLGLSLLRCSSARATLEGDVSARSNSEGQHDRGHEGQQPDARFDALRMIKTALKKHEIDSMKPLDEPTESQILGTLIKQRRESAEMFRKGNRPELAEREEGELKLIESYMPAAPTEAEVDAAISAAMSETGVTSLKQRGMVMKAAQAKLAGKRVDGKALSERVRAKLSWSSVERASPFDFPRRSVVNRFFSCQVQDYKSSRARRIRYARSRMSCASR